MRYIAYLKYGLCLCVLGGLCWTQKVNATQPSEAYDYGIYCDYWYTMFDAAGYSDVINWGNSPYHPHGYHELLSGEWAAAIYYDGIATNSNAMWLTDYFRFPYWGTESDFEIYTWPTYWDDPNNPVVGYDTGKSVIRNNDVEITIDYEIADLGEDDFSPLSYHEPIGEAHVAKSERYVLLQTYTIKNIKASGDITGLEFYQMLHGHGADDYGPVVHCSYDTLDYRDALENYTPYNPVHTVDNFKYDITQWNNQYDPLRQPQSSLHTDWVGFSCTIEPNVYECGYYAGHDEKPPTGTHINIEQRNLDGSGYTYGETAGAMGWYLPTLGPNESTSITVAFMFGTLNWSIPTILTKVNADLNNECVEPVDNNSLVFDIFYDANGYALDNAILVDSLPIEVNFTSCTGGGVHDSNNRTVTWYLDDVGPDDSNTFELRVCVNHYAKPCGVITNHVVLDSNYIYYTQATCDVDVCPWGCEIIYVDRDANNVFNRNNGTSWSDAYTDLQAALERARGCGPAITAIWVAEGTYKPTYDINEAGFRSKSFELLEDVGLFGHFGGVGTYETSTSQRNFTDANNETILEGLIGQSYIDKVVYVVTADDIEDAVLDGFIIEGSYYAGIHLDDANVSIVNCKLKNYYSNGGIYAENHSCLDVHNCTFNDNTTVGLKAESGSNLIISSCIFDGNSTTQEGMKMRNSAITVGSCIFKNYQSNGIVMSYDGSLSLTLINSVVRNNGNVGLFLEALSDDSTITIKNDWIYDNPVGIYIYYSTSPVTLRNNTILGHTAVGIYNVYSTEPNITNCILWNNVDDLYECSATYSCIQSVEDANGIGNIPFDPCFVNSDTKDFHLDSNSPCKNAGDPNGSYDGETDIDGENRVYYDRVDIGADEYYWSNADFSEDGLVNFKDYAVLAASWRSESGEGNYKEYCDLKDNNAIDFNDLALFCEDWLWKKAWSDGGWMMAMGGDGGRGTDGGLMLLDATASLKARPERLIAKTQKFYDITPQTTISAIQKLKPQLRHQAKPKLYSELVELPEPESQSELEPLQPQPQPTEVDIQQLENWFDEIWLNGQLEGWTETEYLEFRESIEDSPQ